MDSYLNHPEYLGIMREVLETPFDTSPRLILADWFSEHGQDDRAEFINLSLGKKGKVQFPEDKRLYDLLYEQSANLPGHGFYFASNANSYPYKTVKHPVVGFCCGLPSEIVYNDINQWADSEDFPILMREQPITRIVFCTYPETVEESDHFGTGTGCGYKLRLDGTHGIPGRLTHELTGEFESYRGDSYVWYENEPKARQDLCRACVNWGRTWNDLPRI